MQNQSWVTNHPSVAAELRAADQAYDAAIAAAAGRLLAGKIVAIREAKAARQAAYARAIGAVS